MIQAAPGRESGSTPSSTLHGQRIVITRPAGQSAPFAALLQAQGAVPVLFPTIDIVPLPDTAELDAALAALARFDLVVFVSANAVAQAFARLPVNRLVWPLGLLAAATGPATAAQLSAHGVERVLYPSQRLDSEGLAEELDRAGVAPKRVLIVRGSGGREWLHEHLGKRGSTVDVVTSYLRVRGHTDAAPLLRMAAARELAATTVTSSEGGEHLLAMLGEQGSRLVRELPMFVPHPRIAARMRALQCTRVIETAAGDAGLLAGLQNHFARVPA